LRITVLARQHSQANMRYVLSATVLLSSLLLSVCDDVLNLTDETYNQVVDGSKHVFLKVYAPWCGHCKSLAPDWEELATTFKAERNVAVAKLDATVHGEIAKQLDVKGYPTLLFFPKGQSVPIPYRGDRSINGLIDWLNQKTFSFRKRGGGILETGGRIAVIDEAITAAFATCKDTVVSACLPKVVAAVKAVPMDPSFEGYQAKVFKYYSSALEKAMSNANWIDSEISRLQALADKGTMAEEQEVFVYARKNVLAFFNQNIKSLPVSGSGDEL